MQSFFATNEPKRLSLLLQTRINTLTSFHLLHFTDVLALHGQHSSAVEVLRKFDLFGSDPKSPCDAQLYEQGVRCLLRSKMTKLAISSLISTPFPFSRQLWVMLLESIVQHQSLADERINGVAVPVLLCSALEFGRSQSWSLPPALLHKIFSFALVCRPTRHLSCTMLRLLVDNSCLGFFDRSHLLNMCKLVTSSQCFDLIPLFMSALSVTVHLHSDSWRFICYDIQVLVMVCSVRAPRSALPSLLLLASTIRSYPSIDSSLSDLQQHYLNFLWMCTCICAVQLSDTNSYRPQQQHSSPTSASSIIQSDSDSLKFQRLNAVLLSPPPPDSMESHDWSRIPRHDIHIESSIDSELVFEQICTTIRAFNLPVSANFIFGSINDTQILRHVLTHGSSTIKSALAQVAISCNWNATLPHRIAIDGIRLPNVNTDPIDCALLQHLLQSEL